MATITSRLRALQKKAKGKGQWAVVASATHLLAEEDNLDARINLVGSMHEVGMLKNSLAPYWATWRSNTAVRQWTQQCVDRLQQSDSDYWALAALLALPISEVQSVLSSSAFQLVAIRSAESYKEGQWHIATFSQKPLDRTLAPVIEVGWDGEEQVIEASRWRAVVLDEQDEVDGSLVGKGFGSYYMRAKLPFGCWRIHHDTFEIRADWIVPKSKTALRNYP